MSSEEKRRSDEQEGEEEDEEEDDEEENIKEDEINNQNKLPEIEIQEREEEKHEDHQNGEVEEDEKKVEERKKFEEQHSQFRTLMSLHPEKKKLKIEQKEVIKDNESIKAHSEFQKTSCFDFKKDLILLAGIEGVQFFGEIIWFIELQVSDKLDNLKEGVCLKISFLLSFLGMIFLFRQLFNLLKKKNDRKTSISLLSFPKLPKLEDGEKFNQKNNCIPSSTDRNFVSTTKKEELINNNYFDEEKVANGNEDIENINKDTSQTDKFQKKFQENIIKLESNQYQNQQEKSINKDHSFLFPDLNGSKYILKENNSKVQSFAKSNLKESPRHSFNNNSQNKKLANLSININSQEQKKENQIDTQLKKELLFEKNAIVHLEKIYFFASFYIVTLFVIRFELFLIRPFWKIYSIVLTVLSCSIIFSKLKRIFGVTLLACLCFYCSCRLLLSENNSIMLYFMSISCTILPIILIVASKSEENESGLAQIEQSYQEKKIQSLKEIQIQEKKSNKEYITEYFKQFYHNIVSMMPQGILIIDQSQNLVYANKTTKTLLNCTSKKNILPTLKSLIVQPISQQGNISAKSFFEDTKTLRTLLTLRSLKSMKSVHLKKPGINSLLDTESFASSYQYVDGIMTPSMRKPTSIIKPVVSTFAHQAPYNNSSQYISHPPNSPLQNSIQKSSYQSTKNPQSQIHIAKSSNHSENIGTSNNIEHGQPMQAENSKIRASAKKKSSKLLASKSTVSLKDVHYPIGIEKSPPTISQGIQARNVTSISFFKQFTGNQNEAVDPIQPSKYKSPGAQKSSFNQAQKKYENKSLMDIINTLLKECAKQLTLKQNQVTLKKQKEEEENNLGNKVDNQSYEKDEAQKSAKCSILYSCNSAEEGQGPKYRSNSSSNKNNKPSNNNINLQNNANNNSYFNAQNSNFYKQNSNHLSQQNSIHFTNNPNSIVNSIANSSHSLTQFNNSNNGSNFHRIEQKKSSFKRIKDQSGSINNYMKRNTYSGSKQRSRGFDASYCGFSSTAQSQIMTSQVLGCLGNDQKNSSQDSRQQQSIRIQVKDRLLEVSFLQCEVKMLQKQKTNSTSNFFNYQNDSKEGRLDEENYNKQNINQKMRDTIKITNGKSPSNKISKNSTNTSANGIIKGQTIPKPFPEQLKLNEKPTPTQNDNSNFEFQQKNTPKTAVVVVFIEDITHEMYVQKLEELNLYKMKMLNSISHELKTPLNCTMGMLEELSAFVSSEEFNQPNSSEMIRSLIEPAQSSNMLLLHMIRDLLDLGTLEFGPLHYSFTRFNLRNLLEDCCKVMKSQAEVKKIDIDLIYEAPDFVISDENRIGQILINFLSNSLKFTNKNGKITVKIEPFQSHFKISVEDNGIGISQKNLTNMFHIFGLEGGFQKKQATQGIGIGLTVSYKLAQGLTLEEFQDKPIQVSSEEKKGSIFIFVIKNQDPNQISDQDGEEEEEDDDDDYYEDDEQILDNKDFDNQSRDGWNPSHDRSLPPSLMKGRADDIPEDFDHEIDEESNSENISRDKKWEHQNKFKINGEENVFFEEETEQKRRGSIERHQACSQMNLFEKYFHETAGEDPALSKMYISNKNVTSPQSPEIYDSNKCLQSLIADQQLIHQNNQQETHLQVQQPYYSQRNSIPKSPTQPLIQLDDTSILYKSSKQVGSFFFNNNDIISSAANIAAPLISNDGNSNFILQANTLNSLQNMPNNFVGNFGNTSKQEKQGKQTEKQNTAPTIHNGQSDNNSFGKGNSKSNTLNINTLFQPSHGSFMNLDLQINLEEFIANNQAKKSELMAEEFGQILIVDDVQFNLLTLSSLLKRYCLKVDMAHDGQEAINKVQEKYIKTGKIYKIIFMDIQMPIKDGFEATKEIRKFLGDNNLFQVPIVATTAFGDAAYKEQSKKVGITYYIEKPLQLAKIDKSFVKHVLKQ